MNKNSLKDQNILNKLTSGIRTIDEFDTTNNINNSFSYYLHERNRVLDYIIPEVCFSTRIKFMNLKPENIAVKVLYSIALESAYIENENKNNNLSLYDIFNNAEDLIESILLVDQKLLDKNDTPYNTESEGRYFYSNSRYMSNYEKIKLGV